MPPSAVLRLIGVLALAALVNLPVLSQWWLGDRLSDHGLATRAEVVELGRGPARGMVRYRIPGAAGSWSARLDEGAWSRARRTHRVVVRYLPGDPAQNRPVGQASGAFVPTVTALADVALLIAAALLVRRRRWGQLRVERQDGSLVVLRLGEREIWAHPGERARVGRTVSIELHAAGHVEPVPPESPPELHRRTGATYDVVGTVVDARRGRCRVESADLSLDVQLGRWRNRASLRDRARVCGVIHTT